MKVREYILRESIGKGTDAFLFAISLVGRPLRDEELVKFFQKNIDSQSSGRDLSAVKEFVSQIRDESERVEIEVALTKILIREGLPEDVPAVPSEVIINAVNEALWHGWYENVRKAMNFFPADLGLVGLLREKLEAFVESGDLYRALEISEKIFDRKLTLRELRVLQRALKKKIGRYFRDDNNKTIDQILVLAGLLPDRNRLPLIRLAIDRYIRFGNMNILEKLKLLPESDRSFFVRKIVKKSLANCEDKFSFHFYLEEFEKALGRRFSQKEIGKIVGKYSTDPHGYILKLTLRLPKSKRDGHLEKFLKSSVEIADLDRARVLAGHIGRELREEEILQMTAVMIAALWRAEHRGVNTSREDIRKAKEKVEHLIRLVLARQ